MNKSVKFIASALLLVSGLLFGQNKIEFEEYDLDNGLHVILYENHKTPNVSISVSYHVGSKNENPDRTGFAHFFEHLLFEGSTNIERGAYDNYIENAGGSLNANTSQDRTFYFEYLPSNQIKLGLWLESERMLHAKVEKIGVETQREVVKEEKRQRVDNQPYGTLMENTFNRAYKEHPYRWVPIGSMEHLNAAQEEDYVNFYRTFYVPNNAVLVVGGDINKEDTKKWIADYFGTIPNGERLNIYRDLESLSAADFKTQYETQIEDWNTFEADWKQLSTDEMMSKYFANASTTQPEIPRPEVVEPALGGEIRDTIYDEKVQLPGVVQAYRIPAQGTPDFYAVEMMNMILSQGASSRFNKEIVEKQELAITTISFPFPMEDPGVALVLGIVNMGVAPDTMEMAMNKEVERMQVELISDKELEKLKNQIEDNFIRGNNKVSDICENLSDYYQYYGNTNLINTEIEKYLAVTKEDIRNAAKKYFNKDNRIVLYYLPKK